MIRYTSLEYEQLGEELKKIEIEAINHLQNAERSCKAVENSVQRIKDFILTYTFQNNAEEINFFKNINPRFVKRLIYYNELLDLEKNKPLGDKSDMIGYYRNNLERIRLFFERNHSLFNYYLAGRTSSDHLFFIRNAQFEVESPNGDVLIDTRFNTIASFKLAKLKAFVLFRDYLLTAIKNEEHPPQNEPATYKITWTDSKAGLIELLYGLQSMGVFNNSQIEVKQIASLFEQIFHVDLGNFYRTFQEIRIRKKNRTAFIDKMKEMLIKRMDDTDEYIR